jgi:hypothetical protein
MPNNAYLFALCSARGLCALAPMAGLGRAQRVSRDA